MYKKLCNRCYHSSYSSCQVGEWVCPTCNQDLTKIKAIIASNRTEITQSNVYQKYRNVSVERKSKISYKI